MKKETINLTPHEIVVGTQTIPASGTVARVATTSKEVGRVGGIPLTVTETGPVEGLPDPSRGVLYVVSALVRIACPERNDIASPGQLVRDDNGRVIGCESLIINQKSDKKAAATRKNGKKGGPPQDRSHRRHGQLPLRRLLLQSILGRNHSV